METKKLDHLNLNSVDGAQLNLDALYKIAPSVFTEALDPKTGKVAHKVDFEALRQLLGDNATDGDGESYQFTWVGKNAAKAEAARSINKTLRPVPEDSVDWDNTKNLYIEGDNLEVLKLLQRSYLGKVKMIYIDPPYNTGNDFVYDDDFARTAAEEDLEAGNVDELGNRYRKNSDSNGKFHSDWCSMIYPRLLVARSLLTEDGVIFISIDDKEQRNLKNICDEVFGSGNFIGNLILKTATDNNPRQITTEHEYILCYAKSSENQNIWQAKNEKALLIQSKYDVLKEQYPNNIEKIQEELRKWIKKNTSILEGVAHYDNVDERGVFHDGDIANTVFGDYKYDVIHPITGRPCKVPEKGFRFPEATMKKMIDEGDIMFGADESTLIKPKKRLENAKDVLRSVIYEDGRASTKRFENLMARDIFQNPKSTTVLERLMTFVLEDNDIILDFFSGSGSTAEALMDYNNKEKRSVRYIMVQIPENLDESFKTADSRAKRTLKNAICFLDSINKEHTIPEIGKERIRRAGKKIKEESPLTTQNLDTGFRVFRLDESNYEEVTISPKDYNQDQLQLFADNIKQDRTDLDLLFGAMLAWGVTLDLPMAKETVDGCTIYTVNNGDLVACFTEGITDKVVTAMADKTPLRVLFRDSCFMQDAQKINIYEQFKQLMDWTDDEAFKNIKVI